MNLAKPIALATALIISLTACSQNASTGTTGGADNDAIKARQALMKDWRSANDIIKGMVENPANFDAATLKEQTKFLADTSKTMWTHFGDANAKGDANDTVWSDAAGFKAATEKFDTAVTALNTAAQTAQSASDIESALGQVGESCGSCHKVFKK